MKAMIMTVICVIMLPLGAAAVQINYPPGYVPYYNEGNAVALAKLVWAEGRGIPSDTEKAAIMWCVINRVEREGCWTTSILGVLKQPGQFAYRTSSPVDPGLYELAKDVLIRWDMERCGYQDVGRVLPASYYYFTGDGKHNYFRAGYRSTAYWNWSVPSPYAS